MIVDGVAAFFRRLPGEGVPVVFVHGNPTHSEDWMPVLERMRGPALAFDLPGFGRSERPPPASFDYSMHGYGRFCGRILERMGIEDHSLVVHDWGAVALLGTVPERIRRLAVINAVPFLPGYRWHRTARLWRTPLLGELSNRLWSRRALDLGLRESRGDRSRHDPAFVDLIWEYLDAGTLAAVLRLYRSAPEAELARAGAVLASIESPALVIWGVSDRYIPARFGRAYADALPSAELVELPRAGHWPWRDEPGSIETLVRFLEPR